MDSRVVYALRTDLWSRSAGVLLDGGDFPMGRVAEIARLVSHVRVVADHGTVAALRDAGVADVAPAPGSTLVDALQATGPAHAPIVFCGAPKKPSDAMQSALSSMTDATGSQLPVAAIMFLRDDPPGDGPLCPLAETSFVSGYGALFSIMLASRTGRSVRVVAPQSDRLRATHTEVVETALELAQRADVRFNVVADPAPRSWVIDHSDRLSAILCGVLEARGRPTEGAGRIAHRAGPETETAVALIEEASCDVVVVMDRVSLARGPTAGARVAKVIGAAMVGAVALSGAAPAAAATSQPATAGSQAAPKAHKRRVSSEVGHEQTGSDSTAAPGSSAADGHKGTRKGAPTKEGVSAGPGVGQASSDAEDVAADESDVATDESDVATDGSDVATDGSDVATGDSSGTADAATDESDVATDGSDVATDGSDVATGDSSGTADAAPISTEMPIEFIAFTMWTDSRGNDHLISSGLSYQPVKAPSLPAWAIRDGGDHPELKKPDSVDPLNLTAGAGTKRSGQTEHKRGERSAHKSHRGKGHQSHNKRSRRSRRGHHKHNRGGKHSRANRRHRGRAHSKRSRRNRRHNVRTHGKHSRRNRGGRHRR